MNILVTFKQIPNLTDDLEVNESGTDLAHDALQYVLNEFDEQALEEAVLAKEAAGGSVTVIGVDTTGELSEALFTALAKGADRALKITGDFPRGASSHTQAALLAEAIRGQAPDLVLTGVQAADDRDGQVGILLASALGLPHVSVVSGVQVAAGGRTATVHQEYAGGVMAELEVDLPAVLGVQAAREAPRYAPVSRVRQAMKTQKLDEIPAPAVSTGAGSTVTRLARPETGGRAEMLEGSPAEIADRLVALLAERGLLRG